MTIEILLTTIIAIGTTFYTIISLLLFFENRKIRKQKINPNLIAYLKASECHNYLELIIKNIGEGIAKDLKLVVLEDYKRLGESNLLLSNLEIVKNGFNHFPPQYKLSYYIDYINETPKKDKNSYIELKIILYIRNNS